MKKWSQFFYSGTRSPIFGHLKMGTFGKSFTKEYALRSFGKGNTVSAQCISIKLRALSHDLRERVLVTFDDHGFIYDEK